MDQKFVDDPCVGICSALFDEYCRGCGRTATEIARWTTFDWTQKNKVWQRIQIMRTTQGQPYSKTSQ